MIRFLHKQLAFALVIAVSGLIAAGVGAAVNGHVKLPGWWFVPVILAWGVFWGLVSTTSLLKEGDLPLFRAAVPVADPATALWAPAEARRWLMRTYGMRFAFWLPLGTALAVYEPLVVTFNLVWAMDPLMRAERAARWERQHRVLLWQGSVDQPEQPVPAGQPPVFTTPRRADRRTGLNTDPSGDGGRSLESSRSGGRERSLETDPSGDLGRALQSGPSGDLGRVLESGRSGDGGPSLVAGPSGD